MPHQGRTGEPWIDENRECSWSAIEAWRGWRTVVGWGEGDEEGRVTVELSDSDRHDERADVLNRDWKFFNLYDQQPPCKTITRPRSTEELAVEAW